MDTQCDQGNVIRISDHAMRHDWYQSLFFGPMSLEDIIDISATWQRTKPLGSMRSLSSLDLALAFVFGLHWPNLLDCDVWLVDS